MAEFIKINPADNVAVAIHDVEAGGCFDIDGENFDVRSMHQISQINEY